MKSDVTSGIACSITVVDGDGRFNERKTTENVRRSTTVMALVAAPRLRLSSFCRTFKFTSEVVLLIPSSGLTIWSPELMSSCFIVVAVVGLL